jgi:hypothetical protein
LPTLKKVGAVRSARPGDGFQTAGGERRAARRPPATTTDQNPVLRSVQGILGPVTSTNPPSYTTVNVDDSADPFAQNATLSQATINGDPNREALSGLAPAAINYYDYDVSSVAMLINSSSSVAVQDDGGIYTTINGQPF